MRAYIVSWYIHNQQPNQLGDRWHNYETLEDAQSKARELFDQGEDLITISLVYQSTDYERHRELDDMWKEDKRNPF